MLKRQNGKKITEIKEKIELGKSNLQQTNSFYILKNDFLQILPDILLFLPFQSGKIYLCQSHENYSS